MDSEQEEILKIEIPVEEDPPLVPAEEARGPRFDVKGGVKAGADKVSQGMNSAAQAAWNSDARKTVSGGVKKGVAKGVTAVAAKSAELMHEHMVKAAEEQAKQQAANVQTKIKETDWQAEAGKGAAAGLRWASQQIGKLAARFNPPEKEPEE